MKKKFVNKRRSRGAVSFNPNRQYIEDAIQQYLKEGGEINHIEVDEKAFESSWMLNDVSSEVDEFLSGQ